MLSSLFTFYAFLIGAVFGSFLSVVLWRLRTREGGILTGRSHCPACGHVLGARTLVPILSYTFLGGRCAYCRKPIPLLYPLLELVMGGLFTLVVWSMIDISLILSGDIIEIARMILMWVVMFVIVAFAVYDILYMEISDEIMVPTVGILLVLLAVSTYTGWPLFGHYVMTWSQADWYHTPLWNGLFAAWIVYTFLFVFIFIPGVIHSLQHKKYSIIGELCVLYVTFSYVVVRDLYGSRPAEMTTTPPPEEDIIPSWMGWGDLRIAIFMGLVLGVERTVVGLFAAYIIGSVVGVFFLMIHGREKGGTEVPFGPFLGAGTVVALTLYDPIIQMFHSLFTHGF